MSCGVRKKKRKRDKQHIKLRLLPNRYCGVTRVSESFLPLTSSPALDELTPLLVGEDFADVGAHFKEDAAGVGAGLGNAFDDGLGGIGIHFAIVHDIVEGGFGFLDAVAGVEEAVAIGANDLADAHCLLLA